MLLIFQSRKRSGDDDPGEVVTIPKATLAGFLLSRRTSYFLLCEKNIPLFVLIIVVKFMPVKLHSNLLVRWIDILRWVELS